MRLAAPLLVLSAATPGAAGKTATLLIRGRVHSIAILSAASPSKGAVLFLPGDGGWRGLALSLSQSICGWGYDVYGFDSKDYLDSAQNPTVAEMLRDMHEVIAWIRSRGTAKVILVGWSQSAGIAVLAAQHPAGASVSGVITLGLPESAVLAWNWEHTVASLAHLDPDPLPPNPSPVPLCPVPLWMIHGDADEYTSRATAERLYRAAAEPKRLVNIRRGNHRFDGARGELLQALEDGLTWMQVAKR